MAGTPEDQDCEASEQDQYQVAAKVSHITLPDFSDVATANPKPGPMVLMEKVERVTSATRTALNEHLDTLTDAELERVLCLLGYHKWETRQSAKGHCYGVQTEEGKRRGIFGIHDETPMKLRDQCGRCGTLL